MVALGSIVVAGIALYLWLAGHWFGRILAFLLFGAIGVFVLGNVSFDPPQMLFVPVGIWWGASWFVAWIPQYRNRAHDASFSEDSAVTLRH